MTIKLKAITGLVTAGVVGTLAVFTGGAAASSSAAAPRDGTVAAANVGQANSQNWAGYVATGNSFSSVSGTWTVPTASANPSSNQSYSATWVGLGGTSGQSQALEQAGTESDYLNGQAEYTAWYELLPAGQQQLSLAVHPGDEVSTSVSVSGSSVKVTMIDQSTGKSVTRTAQMSDPDTSSAEWIVEAPATQTAGGDYQILPLADFGKVAFTSATATANGHTGGISDSDWQTTQVQLGANAGSAVPGDAVGGFAQPADFQESSASATTSALSSDQFTVTWNDGSSGSQSTGGGYSPYGYADGGGGYSPYGYGYGYGSGYGGGGYSPYAYGWGG